jgi:hypothetical protein
MAISERGHLSIFSNKSKESIGFSIILGDLKFFCFIGASTFALMMTSFTTVGFSF